MGKTSFCKYLIHELGTDYLSDVSKRVPIYVRLSEIAKEQELEGLLGKMLAARFRLSNYYFEDVMNLNRRGKFVFIFDGFDEMKHALSWDLLVPTFLFAHLGDGTMGGTHFFRDGPVTLLRTRLDRVCDALSIPPQRRAAVARPRPRIFAHGLARNETTLYFGCYWWSESASNA
jgi:hypothetical protein